MAHTNFNIIDRFFDAYGKRDMDALRQVVSEDVKWTFPGRNPLSGTKIGIDALLTFFDNMGAIMGKSNIKVEKLIMEQNNDYAVECQHIWTNREDGMNLDHHWCVLWRFADGKLIEGKHFSENQYMADTFFNKVD